MNPTRSESGEKCPVKFNFAVLILVNILYNRFQPRSAALYLFLTTSEGLIYGKLALDSMAYIVSHHVLE